MPNKVEVVEVTREGDKNERSGRVDRRKRSSSSCDSIASLATISRYASRHPRAKKFTETEGKFESTNSHFHSIRRVRNGKIVRRFDFVTIIEVVRIVDQTRKQNTATICQRTGEYYVIERNTGELYQLDNIYRR